MGMTRAVRAPALALALLLLGACGTVPEDEVAGDPTPTPTATATPSDATPRDTATPSESSTAAAMPCDPSLGAPRAEPGCPVEPVTGWLAPADEGLTLELFRTLHSDAEGKAYAREHGLEFPFPNDYFDAPTGEVQPIKLGAETVCTGVIIVDFRSPLEDHVVDCAALVRATEKRPIPVAVWIQDDQVLQASELYRP